MGKALYRKYRSRSLDEIVGQSHITSLLKRAISSGNVAHAYLLTGPRGVGKTSIARILAHEINGLPYEDESVHLDIIEIDAASNNSVEDIRDLREKIMVAPAIAKKKIYIIDEVHMLSKSAFNALLKTLEEPPEHAVFILATTDVEKLPATIISRVQRFNFRTIGIKDAVEHLRTIADAELIAVGDSALELIARHGKGSFRDSISLLDQLRSLTDETITPELVENILGLADTETVQQLLAAHEQHNIAEITRLIHDAETRGTSAITLSDQLIQSIRSEISEKPHLLPLLDSLLEVNRSSWPHVKLLTALASSIETTPPQPQKPNKSSADASQASEETLASSPAQQETRISEESRANKQPSDDAEIHRKNEPGEKTKASALAKLDPDQPFPWSDFLTQVKQKTTGVHALLTKCGHRFDGTALTIYAGRAFVKKKIDQALPHLAESLEHIGVEDGTIVVLDTPEPAKDSQSAAILAMMGGGEEVSL